MRFKLDENLPVELLDDLRAAGYEADGLRDEGLIGASDREAVADRGTVIASDDMSLFLEARPGCYFRVGIAPESGLARQYHALEFEMNEAGLPVGLRLALDVMLNALAAEA